MNQDWQIKTTPISEEKEDKLSHNSIASLLNEKINNLFEQKAIPSCICLNGEYGSGKSTIINLLFEKWNGATNKKIVHFNIWRHKEENTYYALLRNIFYALKNKGEKDFRTEDFLESLVHNDEIISLDREFSDLVYNSFSRKEIDQNILDNGINDFLKTLPKYMGKLSFAVIIKAIAFAFIVGLFLGIPYFFISQDFFSSLKLTFITAVTVSASLSLLSFFFRNTFKNLPTLFKFHIQPAETTISLPSISNTEQLQSIFRSMLHKYCKDNKGTKLVIVIEDVDRKNNDEIIATLNELRTFIDLGKAIFIIPCDLNNIERAFSESAIPDNLDKEYTKWKAKDFCTKIFSHVITVPPQNQQDLRLFLCNKVLKENQNHPITQYLEGQGIEELINILIVKSIKTPREAINIFNRFTLQFEHALKLEEDGTRLQRGSISNNVLQYARVYMLSVYYNLEQELLKYPELLDWVLNIFQKDLITNELNGLSSIIPHYAQSDIKALYTDNIITSEIQEFVSRTEIYESSFIRMFIYLDEKSYSGNAGGKLYNDVLDYLKNRNSTKLKKSLSEDTPTVSNAIQKATENINYSTDYYTIIPSLIDVFDDIHTDNQTKITVFILEHFNKILDKSLYGFDPQIILQIFNRGNTVQVQGAKEKYFNILHKDRDSITEYCSIEKTFEIVVSLIDALDKDINYVDKATISLLKDFCPLPAVDDKDESYQKDKYLEIINDLEEDKLKQFFDKGLLERLLTNITGYYNQSKDTLSLKRSINKLISSLIQDDKSVIESIQKLNGHKHSELDSWFIELITEYESIIQNKSLLLETLKLLQENILDIYMTDGKFEKHKKLIEETIALFGRLDGYRFKSFKNNNNDSFSILLEKYEEVLTVNTSSLDYYLFIIECINIHHQNAVSYSFYNTLITSIVEYIETESWMYGIGSKEFKKVKALAQFLVADNRIIKLKEENQHLLRDALIPQLQTKIQQNRANTNESEAIFEFIKELNYAIGFDEILVKWIEQEDLRITHNNQLSLYRDYLKLVDLVKEKLSETYLTQLLTICFTLASRYEGNVTYVELAWKWIATISEIAHKFEYKLEPLEEDIIPLIIESNSSKDEYYPKKIKYYVVRTLYMLAPFEDNNSYQNIYNTMLLWVADEYPETIDWYEHEFYTFYDSNHQYKGIQQINKHSKWNLLQGIIKDSPNIIEELATKLITSFSDIRLFKELYIHTKLGLNWSKVLMDIFDIVTSNTDKSKALLINGLPDDILNQFDNTFNIEPYLIALIKDNFPNKLIALSFIDKLSIPINKKSPLFDTIKVDFIQQCDVNTDIAVLSKLKNWIKDKNLTRASGINSKLKDIKNNCSDKAKVKKLDSIIKY